MARSFFRAMRRNRLIAENPFEDVSTPATGVKDRQHFVSRAILDRVLAACPNINWRVIVRLTRIGGLRTPSETLSLKWSDVHPDEGYMDVHAPKMELHPDKAIRRVPLFPELRAVLEEARELSEPDAEYVVHPRFRQAAWSDTGWRNVNHRTGLLRILKQAGLRPWP